MISNPQAANSPVATRATAVLTSAIASTAATYLYGPDYTAAGVPITPLLTHRPSYLVIQNQGNYNLELRLGAGISGGLGSIIIAPLATYEVAVDVSAGIELYNPNPVVTIPITDISRANPGEVTTGSAHGLTAGQVFQIFSVVGMVEINNLTFIAKAGVAGSDFELSADGVANFNTTAFTAYTSGGIVYYTIFAPTAFSVTQF